MYIIRKCTHCDFKRVPVITLTFNTTTKELSSRRKYGYLTLIHRNVNNKGMDVSVIV